MTISIEQEIVQRINLVRSRFSAARDEMHFIINSEPTTSIYRKPAIEIAKQLAAILEGIDADLAGWQQFTHEGDNFPTVITPPPEGGGFSGYACAYVQPSVEIPKTQAGALR